MTNLLSFAQCLHNRGALYVPDRSPTVLELGANIPPV